MYIFLRIATDAAKPDGCCVILERADWEVRLAGMKLQNLPGVGRAMTKKLSLRGLGNVRDIWDLGEEDGNETLKEILGLGNGAKIFGFCHGKDDRVVAVAPRKTIGAECNYGVRFDGQYGVDYMINGLSEEVERRMVDADVKGKKVTLKMMKKKEGVQTVKFNGHGPCDNLSKTKEVPGGVSTRSASTIASIAQVIFLDFNIHKNDIRGMGIVLSSLDAGGEKRNSAGSKEMATWLQKRVSLPTESIEANKKPNTREDEKRDRSQVSQAQISSKDNGVCLHDLTTPTKGNRSNFVAVTLDSPSVSGKNGPETLSEDTRSRSTKFPSINQIDVSIWKVLPADIQRELEEENEKNKVNIEERSIDLTDDSDNEFSGFDKEVMRALPTDIRLEVEQEFKRKKAIEEFDHHSFELTDDSGNEQNSASTRRLNRRSLHVEENLSHVKKPRTRKRKLDKDQPSLTQMMKLATVVSGQDQMRDKFSGDAVSLTEFRSLPLRLQLQITNDLQEGIPTRRNSIDDDIINEIESTNKNRILADSSAPSNLSASSAPSNTGDSECTIADDVSYPKDYYTVEHTSLQNDILPLIKYLDEEQNPEEDEISRICQFLRICIDEKRMCTVSILLRTIRKRNDVWGSTSIYCQILKDIESYGGSF